MTRQLAKAAQPSLSSVSVSWQQFNSDAPPLQAPSHVTALFSGSRQVIYGFVPNCTQVSGIDQVVDGSTARIAQPLSSGRLDHRVVDGSTAGLWTA